MKPSSGGVRKQAYPAEEWASWAVLRAYLKISDRTFADYLTWRQASSRCFAMPGSRFQCHMHFCQGGGSTALLDGKGLEEMFPLGGDVDMLLCF